MPTFPYAQPMGALEKIIAKLRSSFPEKVDAAVLRKLGIAPNNESYIINTIRFLGIIDQDSARTKPAHDLFVLGDEEFRNGLSGLIKTAYKSLFDLHGDAAWTLDKQALVSFFRTEDKSTELVGNRQADTFVRLAEMAAKRETLLTASGDSPRRPSKRPEKKTPPKGKSGNGTEKGNSSNVEVRRDDAGGRGVALAVKVEVNLPATSDQSVYDAIFKSIRANLIDID